MRLPLLAPLLLLSLLAGCGGRGEPRAELVVSAAASLAGVMREAAEVYGRGRPGVVIRNNFGASGLLEQQIRHGAAVDLFLPASARELESLAADGLVEAATRRELAENRLVLVVPAARPSPVRDLEGLARAGVRRVAMGTPASVPAGRYARALLERQGLWPRVAPKVVYTGSVRQALTYAERGEVDAALVYHTDALASAGVRVVHRAPAGSHPPIVYPGAVVAASRSPDEARRYLDFLAGPQGAAVFRRHGFVAGAEGS